ncbi:MAG: class I SAM-dependent methyltransferase [Symbiobacteriaceae bacterium]|nr:class I SAM-dependent methyltransferase [Symbiobacteriaceae bacterium]
MNYYANNLNAYRLQDVYQTQLPAVREYLDSEIAFVRGRLSGTERILELGAGYGRIMRELSPYCGRITGIDISEDNVAWGQEYLREAHNADLLTMDAHQITAESFDSAFNMVLCLQNGLSAMKAEPLSFIGMMLSLLVPGGSVIISTYSEKFWQHRLAWFIEQADKGLLGEIDPKQSRDGIIVCKDGFQSLSHTPEQFTDIGRSTGYPYEIVEVQEASLFLIITKVKYEKP